MLYLICRLDHLIDARRTLGIMPGKSLVIALNHRSIELVNKEFIDPMKEWMEQSPYFNGGMLHKDLDGIGVKFIADRSFGMTPAYIGTDVIGGVLSEINFVREDIAWNRVDTITKRFTSRFDRVMDYFGLIILDSSARGTSSVVDKFMADNPYENKTLTIRASRWEVRKHMNYYGQKGWFKVFAGDGTHAPFIVTESRCMMEDMDAERLIDVPEECRADFEMNLETAIQDLAGISTMGCDSFFSNPEIIAKCQTLPSLHEEVIMVDFYDKYDDIMFKIDRAVVTIPRNKVIYIRVDYGAVKDCTGLCICYFDGYETYSRDSGWKNINKVVRMPIIKCPVCVSISRPNGQETSLAHIEQLILDLSKLYQIGMVTCDQFGSRQLIQDLQREGIPAEITSVIKNDQAFVTLKNLMLAGTLHIPKGDRIRAELLDLKRQGDKVVPGSRGAAGEGSHDDVAEALAGAVQSLYDVEVEEFGQDSHRSKVQKLADSTKARITNAPEARIQDAIGLMYGR